VAPVGEGVSERRIDIGPGYRIYFGSVRTSHSLDSIVLLAGGTKRQQQRDIRNAKVRWKDYRRRQHKDPD
jgi:putative addiction module killer protein